jgi:hypothetical protein
MIAQGQQHLGVRVVGRDLAPVARRGPIDASAVVREDPVPVRQVAARRRLPVRQLLRIVADLEHVMAGPEAEPFERQLQRIGPGPPQGGPDDLKRHVMLLDC